MESMKAMASTLSASFLGLGRTIETREVTFMHQTISKGVFLLFFILFVISASSRAQDTPGTGSVFISGALDCTWGPPYPTWYCSGADITITVNGFSVGYSANCKGCPEGVPPAGPTASDIAQSLAAQLNVGGSPVSATASGATVYMIARAAGSSTNYSLSASSTWAPEGPYVWPAFDAAPSGSNLTGGMDWGYISPKYLILGVTYSPPGSQSTVTYASNTVVGNSSSVADSFLTGVSVSVSTEASGRIFGVQAGTKRTFTNAYTQQKETASSIAVNQSTSTSLIQQGVTTPAGVNHDYDYIWVLLNPTFTFLLDPVSNQVQWTGYGYDLNDAAAYPDMEVIGLQVGYLNGHFGPMPAYIAGRLARSWANANQDGTGPGLTSVDLANILAADPFSDPNYTFIFPLGSDTTQDGRFTACNNSGCNQTIRAQPGITSQYSQGYSITQTASQTAKYTNSRTFAVEITFQVSGWWAKFVKTLSVANTVTSSHQFAQSTNSSHGQTASFSITGPPPGYTGPQLFTVFQDNLHGTFVFRPVL